ncbi:MAG TPA: hypothetical protein VGG23_02845, partial [Acidimicrobiales bacterium]
ATAEEKARHPEIDEAVLTSALGQRSAALLRSAHEEAARIAQTAEEAANAQLREAQRHASEAEVGGESNAAERIAEAELAANSVRQQAREEATVLVETARLEAEAIGERARDQGRAMLEQAQEARRRVLADMAVRRRTVTDQIEQFRAARDQIAASMLDVRGGVDRIVADLGLADGAARSAAAAAGHQGPRTDDMRSLVGEAERAAAEMGIATGEAPTAASVVDPPTPAAGLRVQDVAVAVPVAAPPTESPSVEPGPPEAEPAVPSVLSVPSVPSVPVEAAAVDETVVPGIAGEEVGAEISIEEAELADVDGLFARIRAGTTHDDAGQSGAAPAVPEASAESEPEQPGPAEPAPVEAQGVEDAGEAEDDDEDEADEEELGGLPPDPEAVEALAQRAEILDPIVTSMARRLKRALQDDQNRLLDRLRQGTGEWRDDLLVDEQIQRDLYRKASNTQLRDAVGAGISFARSRTSAKGQAPAPDPAAVDALSDGLAESVVTLLRRRLEGGDVPDAAER